MERRARMLWLRTEPLHAVVYFHPQCRGMGRELGLKGFWMGYFATRAAPLGPVGPALTAAVFSVFAPSMIARALPAAWDTVTPAEAVTHRARAAAAALRALAPGTAELYAQVERPLRAMIDAAPAGARPLFAANRELCDGVGSDPVERLWQLTTTVREYRGDAHACVLADHELDGCEALLLAASTGRVPAEGMRLDRGWSEEEWDAARERLRERGLLEPTGWACTPRGRERRQRIEDETDRLSARLLRPLEKAEEVDALITALGPAVAGVLAAGVLPFPNPIGLPRPEV
ncbi:SCO6745 family protein [Streptomyces netropsis]